MAERRRRRGQARRRHRRDRNDKATMEVEAVDEGKLARILINEGTEGVAVNTPIAVLTVNGEDASTPSRRRKPRQNRRWLRTAPIRRRSRTRGRKGSGRRHWRLLRRRRRTGGRPSRQRCVRRCATPWRWRCGATATCSCWARKSLSTRRLQDQPGAAGGVRAAADHRHTDYRARLRRHGRRRGAERAAADC